jgi:hypothetical protein
MNTIPRFIAALAIAGAFVSSSLSAAESGPYIRLDNGVSSISGAKLNTVGDPDIAGALDTDLGSRKTKFRSGYIFGGAVGYRFNESLSAEIELDHAENRLDSVDGAKVNTSIRLKQTSLLASGIYHIKLAEAVTLNLGAGAGAQFCRNNIASEADSGSDVYRGVPFTYSYSGSRTSDTSFIAQLKTGVSVALAKGLTFDAGYKLRFVGSSDLYDVNYTVTALGTTRNGSFRSSLDSRLNHVFSAGFTYSF